MVGGESVRRGVLGQLRQTQRLRVADQLAQDAVPRGQVPDLRAQLVADAHGEELGELLVVADDAEGSVLRVHEDHGRLDDAAQHLWQVQLPAHRHDRLEEPVQPVPGAADLVDPHLQLFEQFVQSEPGHPSDRGFSAVPAHRHLRQRTRGNLVRFHRSTNRGLSPGVAGPRPLCVPAGRRTVRGCRQTVGTVMTGQCARCRRPWTTEPRCMPLYPPRPRRPTTTAKACSAAFASSSTGCPMGISCRTATSGYFARPAGGGLGQHPALGLQGHLLVVQPEDRRLEHRDDAQLGAPEVGLLTGEGERGLGGFAPVDAHDHIGRLLADVLGIADHHHRTAGLGRHGDDQGSGTEELGRPAQVS